jgi:hypothetical protein
LIGESRTKIASITLYFSCARHMRDVAGPAKILASFICELISAFEFPILRRIQKRLEEVDASEVEEIWPVFKDLVEQLPENIVLFCILDEITEYEFSGRRHATEYLVERLVELCHTISGPGKPSYVLKVLLTGSTATRTLDQGLDMEHVLELPDNVPAVGEFSEAAWRHIEASRLL